MSYITSDIKTGNISQLRNLTPLELKQYDLFYCVEDGKEGNFKVDLTDTTSLDDGLNVLISNTTVRLKRISGLSLNSVPTRSKIEKYTSEASLPTTGSLNVVYFLNVSGTKYLKFWNGGSYVNASSNITLPNCISDSIRDYYAKYSDINLSAYNGKCIDIVVIEDETQSNYLGKYFYDGLTMHSYFSLNVINNSFPYTLPLTLS